MSVSLKSIKEQAGIEDILFIKAKELAKDEIVFCIVDVRNVKVPHCSKKQWRLTIHVTDGLLKPHTYYLVLPRDEQLDTLMVAIIDALQTEQPIHSCLLLAYQTDSKPYYNIEDSREDDGKLVCCCSMIR
jgi:hypothetical protein